MLPSSFTEIFIEFVGAAIKISPIMIFVKGFNFQHKLPGFFMSLNVNFQLGYLDQTNDPAKRGRQALFGSFHELF